ncbi:uncharacterized protein LOC113207322 [Frankliniella occidentalis]|uniref:Uncharacterized protein LOC113207322 n=1 Tax=Frankliniella occidentalis TaxID=133901 RepID=A0A9C6U8Y3_FRAOC|nr:uncharacterized protein LOC113207322 [Frankliniella occidentalis]
MESLPDEVLVMVMRHVAVTDLFSLRLVCKRFAGLALHPDAWRYQRLNGNSPRSRPDAVLRIAPCLAELTVTLPARDRPSYHWTTCAVESLVLNDYTRSSAAYGGHRASQVIRRQAELGRLRRLSVNFQYFVSLQSWQTVGSTSGLKKLEVRGFSPRITGDPGMQAPPSSLEVFTCGSGGSREQTTFFIDFILAAHAATLREVNLRSVFIPAPASTAPLLAAIKGLQKLQSTLLPGLEAVAACESLRRLHLVVSRHCHESAPAAELLRRALHLHEVGLVFYPGGIPDVEVDVALDLLGALSSVGSRVEVIALYLSSRSLPDEHFHLLQPLLAALPSLRHLRRLVVSNVPDDLLLAINPEVAPALRTLATDLTVATCAHAWIHRDSVRTVMWLNPLLHVEVTSFLVVCGDLDACEVCLLDYYSVLSEGCRRREQPKNNPLSIGLYSHDPGDTCATVHKAAGFVWISVPALRQLQHLHVRHASDALLLAITPDVAPLLRTLTTELPRDTCAHAWIHRDPVKSAMWLNPLLHIEVKSNRAKSLPTPGN